MQYLQAIWDEHRYLGNWLPSRALAVGDVGIWDRESGFTKATTLIEKNLGFQTATSAYGGGTLQSNSGYTIAPEGDVDLSNLGQGKVVLKFAQEGSFALHAEGCESTTIAGADDVFRRVKSLVRDELWNPAYVIITEVVTARAATVLVSKDRDANVEVTGLSSGGGLISGNFAITANTHQVTKFATTAGATLMFKGFRVNRNWLMALRARPAVFDLDAAGVGPLKRDELVY